MSDPVFALSQRLGTLETRMGQTEVKEVGVDWGAVAGRHLSLPELRAFWPFSSIDENGGLRDLSGQGRTLANINGVTRGIYNDLVAYGDFNGSTQYFNSGDSTAFSPIGAITFGLWVRPDVVNAFQCPITKWNPTGAQRSYGMQLTSSAGAQVFISSTGVNTIACAHTATLVAAQWYHVVGRYTPSTELALFLDGVKVVNTTSIPAAIFDSTSDFRIGNLGDNTQYLDGRAALAFLCADDLPDTLIQELYLVSEPFFR